MSDAAPRLMVAQWANGLEGLGALLDGRQPSQQQDLLAIAPRVRDCIRGLLLVVVGEGQGAGGDDDDVMAVPRLWSALASLGWLSEEGGESGVVSLLARAAEWGVMR